MVIDPEAGVSDVGSGSAMGPEVLSASVLGSAAAAAAAAAGLAFAPDQVVSDTPISGIGTLMPRSGPGSVVVWGKGMGITSA